MRSPLAGANTALRHEGKALGNKTPLKQDRPALHAALQLHQNQLAIQIPATVAVKVTESSSKWLVLAYRRMIAAQYRHQRLETDSFSVSVVNVVPRKHAAIAR